MPQRQCHALTDWKAHNVRNRGSWVNHRHWTPKPTPHVTATSGSKYSATALSQKKLRKGHSSWVTANGLRVNTPQHQCHALTHWNAHNVRNRGSWVKQRHWTRPPTPDVRNTSGSKYRATALSQKNERKLHSS